MHFSKKKNQVFQKVSARVKRTILQGFLLQWFSYLCSSFLDQAQLCSEKGNQEEYENDSQMWISKRLFFLPFIENKHLSHPIAISSFEEKTVFAVAPSQALQSYLLMETIIIHAS